MRSYSESYQGLGIIRRSKNKIEHHLYDLVFYRWHNRLDRGKLRLEYVFLGGCVYRWINIGVTGKFADLFEKKNVTRVGRL